LAATHHPRIFYGWWIVLAAGLGQFGSVGFGSVLLSVVLEPMTAELGWTRAEFTSANAAAALLGALLSATVIGPLVDRHGARPLMLTGALVFGATLLATSRVTELWQFVALQVVAGVLAVPLVAGVVVNVPLSKWFVLRRGWAISMASSGFSFGTMIMPLAVTAVVTSVGWRDAYVVLALLFWALMVPAALLMRRQPEDYGMLPDGQRELEAASQAERDQLERVRRDDDQSYTRRDALRTSAFWMLTITFGVIIAANIAMVFHAIPYLTGSGFTPARAGLAFGISGISGLAAKFVWGAALQRAHRFGPREFSGLAFAAAGIGTLLLVVATRAESMPIALLAFLIWGFGFGSVTPLSEYMWATYFGRRHLGAVRSAGLPFTVAAISLGPLLVAVWFDAAGSYNGAFLAMAVIYALGIVSVLTSHEPAARAPARPSNPEQRPDEIPDESAVQVDGS
jgi:MFS transporter, OFA family, oxalate/formate antiporter